MDAEESIFFTSCNLAKAALQLAENRNSTALYLTWHCFLIMLASLVLLSTLFLSGVPQNTPQDKASGGTLLRDATPRNNHDQDFFRNAQEHFKHAKTYYWLSISEGGNPQAFSRSRAHLNQAFGEVQSLREPASDLDPKWQQLHRGLVEMGSTLAGQQEIASDTHYGIFPLARFFTSSLFTSPAASGTFELIDDPPVMAVTGAAQNLRHILDERSKRFIQTDYVVVAPDSLQELREEVYAVFNQSPRFFAQTSSDVAGVLPAEEVSALRKGTNEPALASRLLNAFNSSRLLVIRIIPFNRVDDIVHLELKGKIFNAGSPLPSQTLSAYGFSRDRRGELSPVLLWNALLLILALMSFGYLTQVRGSRLSARDFVVPALAFFFGRVVPWVSVPLLASIAPAPDALAMLSFWWPALLGLVLFVGTPIAFWLVMARLQLVWPALRIDGRGAATGLAVAFGTAAYVAVPALLYHANEASLYVGLAMVGGGAIAFALGEALDQSSRLSWEAGVVAATSLIVGPALLHDHALLSAAGSLVPGLLLGGGIWSRAGRGRPAAEPDAKQQTTTVQGGSDLPRSVEGLIHAAHQPRYQTFDDSNLHERISERIAPLRQGKTTWLYLSGRSGTGKSATARKLTGDLKSEWPSCTILRGRCSDPLVEPEAYEPFREALRAHYNIGPDSSSTAQLRTLQGALQGMIEALMPIASILVPPDDDAGNRAASRKEMFDAVIDTLRRLARPERPLILFIDDLHWMDEASKALLEHIRDEFGPEDDEPILFLLTSRPALADGTPLGPSDVGLSSVSPLKLPALKQHHREQILTGSLGVAPSAARRIVRDVSEATPDERGQLFWLLQAVEHLARKRCLEKTEAGFALTAQCDQATLPIPSAFREALSSRIEEARSEYQPVLTCAACLGQTFRARTLQEVLGLNRLELLETLHGIEGDTGFIEDVKDEDDVFQFTSSYVLEGVREALSVTGAGPLASAPQLIREYHAQIATALESEGGTAGRIASHYYAAGRRYAEKGKEACLRAIEAALEQYDYDQARDFVEMAVECAVAVGDAVDADALYWRIACEQAHVLGSATYIPTSRTDPDTQGQSKYSRKEVAIKGRVFLEEREPPQGNANAQMRNWRLMQAVATVCYDVTKNTNENEAPGLFSDVGQLARQLSESQDPVIRASGYHFQGLAFTDEDLDHQIELLRSALQILRRRDHLRTEGLRLKGRVMNSLAEKLIRRGESDADRSEAEVLFRERLTLNREYHLGDRPGVARTHGGLGRLYLYLSPKDPERARKHFSKNLEISKEIGDEGGQAMMHSSIGQCYLEEDRFLDALDRYKDSYDLSAESTRNQLFALCGALTAAAGIGDDDAVQRWGRRLQDFASRSDGIVFEKLVEPVEQALDASEAYGDELWHQALR